jgi:hypothetical protein
MYRKGGLFWPHPATFQAAQVKRRPDYRKPKIEGAIITVKTWRSYSIPRKMFEVR